MGYPTVSPVAPILVNHNGNPKSLILTIPEASDDPPGCNPGQVVGKETGIQDSA